MWYDILKLLTHTRTPLTHFSVLYHLIKTEICIVYDILLYFKKYEKFCIMFFIVVSSEETKDEQFNHNYRVVRYVFIIA